MQPYEFPVSLQPAFSKSGKQAPRIQLVVNDETDIPIATVGRKYKLVPHSGVVEKAKAFVKHFGAPTENYYLAKNGAVLICDFTFLDRTIAVGKGDLVGFKVYVENSYNAQKKLKVRVGGIVLACMNGMISHKAVYDMEFKHVESAQEIAWPDPEKIWGQFQQEGEQWNKLTKIELLGNEYGDTAQKAVDENIIAGPALDGIENDENKTAWGLYNRFTYHINHKEKKSATMLGKLSRLTRVNQFFEQLYA